MFVYHLFFSFSIIILLVNKENHDWEKETEWSSVTYRSLAKEKKRVLNKYPRLDLCMKSNIKEFRRGSTLPEKLHFRRSRRNPSTWWWIIYVSWRTLRSQCWSICLGWNWQNSRLHCKEWDKIKQSNHKAGLRKRVSSTRSSTRADCCCSRQVGLWLG